MRSYETYLDNIEMMIFTAFCKLPNLTLDEKTILNYYSNTIRLKLENKLLVDIVANNFRDLEEDDLKLYIKNKTQKYYDMICNCIIDQNDNILPNRDITPSITHINQDILYDIYSYIYRSVITAGKCCDKSSTTTR